jgi:hypothetical protein
MYKILACVFAFAVTLVGQTAVQQFKAEVPDAFGSVPGRVVLAGDQFVFTSDTKPEASFHAARPDIQSVTAQGDVITLQLKTPIKDASGERSRLTVRASDPTAMSAINTWFNLVPVSGVEASSKPAAESRIFEAHHKKTFGGSRGRLLVTADGLAYESIDDVQDSRRWLFRDIKEVKLKSPYEFEVKPFNGDDYTFGIDGQGMGTAEYRDLVDRITQARAEPRK